MENIVQVYTLDKEILLDLLKSSTKYRRFLVLRAMQRRAHFKQTFQEMQQMRELKLKTKGQDLRDLEISVED